jgi:hypothetical protein
MLSIDARFVMSIGAIGVGATLMMDLWNIFLKTAFRLASLNYCLLGRWIGHMPLGVVRHASIAAASPRPFECALGRLAHYTIGVGLAVMFIVVAPGDWLANPTLAPALLFGIATVVFPFLVMQPAFGLGVASSRAPNPTQARLKSLASHTVFGAGLYLVALGARFALPS